MQGPRQEQRANGTRKVKNIGTVPVDRALSPGTFKKPSNTVSAARCRQWPAPVPPDTEIFQLLHREHGTGLRYDVFRHGSEIPETQ